jgi:hypothetical protein
MREILKVSWDKACMYAAAAAAAPQQQQQRSSNSCMVANAGFQPGRCVLFQ